MKTATTPLSDGIQTLWDHLRAAFEKRLTTPTNQPVPVVLEPFTMTEADCEEMDMAIHRWKQSGGPARDNERRALHLQMSNQAQTGRFL